MGALEGITVSGSGVVRAPVDRVELALAVEVLRPDAGAAFTAAAASVAAVLGVLADDGVDSRHVRTADLQLGPRTSYQDNREVLLGYSCGQRLLATLEGLSTLPRLLSDLATTGVEGVRFEGISFGTADSSAAAGQARELAMTDARTKAADLARLAGRELGAITSIAESTGGGGGPRPMYKMQAMAASMPVAGGESEISVSIEVHFELI